MNTIKRLAAVLLLTASAASAALKPGDFVTEAKTKEKKIALTFDDGPGPNTEKFLDLLEKYNVKATFFVLGEQARLRPAVMKKIVDKGHEPASHTMTHINYNRRYKFHLEKTGNADKAAALAETDLVKDMKDARVIIEKNGGKKLKLLRMPHGIDRPWIKAAAKQAGFILVNWTYGSDWSSTPAEKQIPDYLKALKPGAIILLHDGWPKSDQSLTITEAVLKAAKEKGFQLVTVGELLGVEN